MNAMKDLRTLAFFTAGITGLGSTLFDGPATRYTIALGAVLIAGFCLMFGFALLVVEYRWWPRRDVHLIGALTGVGGSLLAITTVFGAPIGLLVVAAHAIGFSVGLLVATAKGWAR